MVDQIIKLIEYIIHLPIVQGAFIVWVVIVAVALLTFFILFGFFIYGFIQSIKEER